MIHVKIFGTLLSLVLLAYVYLNSFCIYDTIEGYSPLVNCAMMVNNPLSLWAWTYKGPFWRGVWDDS